MDKIHDGNLDIDAPQRLIEVDRFYVQHGYSKANTGGGCMAYYRAHTELGIYVLVTARDDANMPSSLKEPVTVGLYESCGEARYLAQFHASTSTEAMERITRGDWTKAS